MNHEESVLYTDGAKVQVTTHALIVDSVRYLLKGIAEVRLHLVKHHKYPPLTILIAGIAAIIMGISGAFSHIKIEDLYIGDFFITANRLSAIVCIALLLMSLLWLSILHDEYVVVITTEEGNKNPLSSTRKDYINRVVTALKTAITFQRDGKTIV